MTSLRRPSQIRKCEANAAFPDHPHSGAQFDAAEYVEVDTELPERREDLIKIGENLDSRLRTFHRVRHGDNATRVSIAINDTVLEFIREFGAMAFLSPLVIRTLRCWEREYADSPAPLERLGEAIVKSAKRRWGRAKGRIGFSDKIAKQKAVPELRLLRQNLVVAVRDTSNAVSLIADELRNISKYPYLFYEKRSFLGFLKDQAKAAHNFASGGLSVERLLHKWIAWSRNLGSEEHVRQQISRESMSSHTPQAIPPSRK